MRTLFIILIFMFAGVCVASNAEVIDVTAELTPAQKYNLTVTIKHADTGWDHYANAWRIYSPEGKLIGERVLYHPHVKEQPFTRTLRDIHIPADLSEVMIIPYCSKTGESAKGYTLKLR